MQIDLLFSQHFHSLSLTQLSYSRYKLYEHKNHCSSAFIFIAIAFYTPSFFMELKSFHMHYYIYLSSFTLHVSCV